MDLIAPNGDWYDEWQTIISGDGPDSYAGLAEAGGMLDVYTNIGGRVSTKPSDASYLWVQLSQMAGKPLSASNFKSIVNSGVEVDLNGKIVSISNNAKSYLPNATVTTVNSYGKLGDPFAPETSYDIYSNPASMTEWLSNNENRVSVIGAEGGGFKNPEKWTNGSNIMINSPAFFDGKRTALVIVDSNGANTIKYAYDPLTKLVYKITSVVGEHFRITQLNGGTDYTRVSNILMNEYPQLYGPNPNTITISSGHFVPD
jgi:hypothetical protein